MLADWYFCCCIEAGPAATRAFLSMLEIIDDRESEGRLMHLTFQELKRADPRMQIYALLHLIRGARLREENIKAAAPTREYFDSLSNAAPEELSPSLNSLFEQVLLGEKARVDILTALEFYLKDLKEKAPERRCTPRPYLDLNEFLPETAALAVVSDACVADPQFAEKIAKLLGDEISDLNTLVQDALDHRFGRLPFLLAVRLTQVVPTQAFSRTSVEGKIWKNKALAPAFEPDLLRATAELAFEPNPEFVNDANYQKVVDELISEAAWFPMLRRVLAELSPQDRRASAESPLAIMELAWTDNRELTLPIIFWQATLWDLGSRLWPDFMATSLMKYWRSPTRADEVPRKITIYHSKNLKSISLRNQYSALAQLRDLKPREIQARDGVSRDDFTALTNWIFLSPWVQQFGEKERKISYLTARDSQEILIRLMAAVPIAVRLLKTLAEHDSRCATYASLVAHAADVLGIFRKWLNNFAKPHEMKPHDFKVSMRLTGLALFGRRLTNLAGTGRFDQIHPSVFADLLDNESAEWMGQRVQKFRDTILPEIIFEWIADAYPGAIDDRKGGRWLSAEIIDRVYSHFLRANHSEHEQLNAAMVVRFVRRRIGSEGAGPQGQAENLSANPMLDWVEESRVAQWKLDHRKLLLSDPELLVEQWNTPWTDPDWKKDKKELPNGKRQRLDEATPIVRALQRATYLRDEIDLNPVKKAEWEADWKDRLNRIDKNRNLPRYVRLRLIELLDHPAFKRFDDQELIVSTLLEYGSIYDLLMLFEKIFAPAPDGLKTRQALHLSTVRALFRRLQRDEINPDQNREQQGAQDPRETFVYYQRAELIRKTLARLAFTTGDAEIRDLIRELHEDLLNSQITKTTRKTKVHIEQQGEKFLLFASDASEIPNEGWLQAQITDLNTFNATLLYDEFDLTDVDNLFESPQLDRQYNDHELHNVLAVLVEKIKLGNEWKFNFNCGRTRRVPLRSKQDLDLDIGDYVSLPVRAAVVDGKRDLLTRPGEVVGRLKRRLQTGDIVRIEVVETISNANERCNCQFLKDGVVLNPDEVDRNAVIADLSRQFRLNTLMKSGASQTRVKTSSLFSLSPEKRWVTVPDSLIALITDTFSDPKLDAGIVLCLAGRATGSLGEPAWLLSRAPGRNYLLTQDEFTDDARELIQGEVARIVATGENPRGLLLTVRPVNDKGRIRLALVDASQIDTYALFPKLKTPFDTRNLDWRSLFENVEAVEAVRNGRWQYHLKDEIPGYPPYVAVKWEDREPQGGRAEFIPIGWRDSYQRALVGAEQETQQWISVPRNEWERFLDDWLDVREGMLVWVHRVGGALLASGSGYLRSYTRENMMLNVEAESFSMRAYANNDRIRITRKRLTRITEVKETPHTVRVQITENADKILVGDYCVGILIQSPDLRAVWETDDGFCLGALRISSAARIYPGSLVEGKLVNGEWQFQLIERELRGRALWQRDDAYASEEGLIFLGESFDAETRKQRPLAETEEEYFGFLPHLVKGVSHAAVSDGRRYNGGFKPTEPARITTNGFYRWRQKHRRAVLFQDGQLLSGYCEGDVPFGDLLAEFYMEVGETFYDTDDTESRTPYYELCREFLVQTAPRRSSVTKREDEWHDMEEWTSRLKTCLMEHRSLPARYNPSDVRQPLELLAANPPIRVPNDRSMNEWTPFAKLAANEGPFVQGNRYPADAVVQLFETSAETFEASFQRVPPLTPIEYKRKLGCRFGIPASFKDSRLFYVGREENDPITQKPHAEPSHRFEMGYGKTMLVPESKLRYDGRPVTAADYILFHGDEILSLIFSRTAENPEDIFSSETEENSGECYVHIEEINIRYSARRTLFQQRLDHQLVHRLRITIREDDVVIDQIDSYKPDRLTDIHSFETIPSELDYVSKQLLIKRLHSGESERRMSILGRLDEERFKASYGKDVFFDHVRLSFEDSPLGRPLKDGDTVLLETGRIETLWNDDIGVRLEGSYLCPEDIGGDWKKWEMMLRREHFSVRADLLERLAKEQAKDDELQKKPDQTRVMFVKLVKKEHKKRALASLISRPLARAAEALYSDVARLRGKPRFAAVVTDASDYLTLEIRPGLFVRVKAEQIALPRPSALERGALVRIENVSNSPLKFRITLAAFGSSRYIKNPRLAVAFPKSDLFKPEIRTSDNIDDPNFWQRGKHFLIGGLAGVTAFAGMATRSRWAPPKPQEMIELMRKPHPKIVWLGQDSTGFRIQPAAQEPAAGSLHVDDDLNVSYVRTGKQWTASDCPILNWSSLTFADRSAEDVVLRASREPWRFAFTKTGSWGASSQESEYSDLADHTVWNGPLFFQNRGRDLLLRYSPDRYLEFGYPVDELFASLRQKENLAGTYHVAGPSDREGLWIELAPGRIVEVPAQLFTWTSKLEGEQSLANFNWNGFAAGDEVDLQIVSSDPTEFDRIRLTGWRPGPRGAFGARALLGTEPPDPERGALQLGHGSFTLTLPVSRTARAAALTLLHADNWRNGGVQPNNELEKLQPSDTVLLTMSMSGKPRVHGFRSHFFLRPAEEQLDSVLQHAISNGRSRRMFNFEALGEVIEAAGGALPVTVEQVLSNGSNGTTLVFSRRIQQQSGKIPAGKISFGHLVNPIGNGHMALIRCGSALYRVRMADVVSGIPPTMCLTAALRLREANVKIWLRGDAEGNIEVGVQPPPPEITEILVESLCVVEPPVDTSAKPGLICQAIGTRALYWLPAGQLAWTELSAPELRHFYGHGRQLTVRRSGESWQNSYVSAIKVRAVDRELEELTTGREINVTVIDIGKKLEAGSFQYLVESFHSRIVLKCIATKRLKGRRLRPDQIAAGEHAPESFVPAEVVNRTLGDRLGNPPTVTVVPIGQKWLTLDLPNWLTNPELLETGVDVGAKTTTRPITQISREQLSQLDDDTLDELLRSAYAALRTEEIAFLVVLLDITKEWIERNKPATELVASHGLMAILILSECANLAEKNPSSFFPEIDPRDVKLMAIGWRNKATDLMRSLGRRALRSMHVEILANSWLLNPYYRNYRDELWGRLQGLQPFLPKAGRFANKDDALALEDLNTIRQFSYAVKLRHKESLFAIATALLATIGEPSEPLNQYDEAHVTRRMVQIYRAFPRAALNLWLPSALLSELRLLVDYIQVNDRDIRLLRPFTNITQVDT